MKTIWGTSKRITLLISLGIMFTLTFIGLVSATSSLGTVKQNDCIDLYQSCPSCSYVNLTAIKYPDVSVDLMNVAMTKTDSEYNYTFCNTSIIGEFFYTIKGDKDGVESTEIISFEVTPSGRIAPNSGEGMTYLASIGSIILVTIFFFSLSFVFKSSPGLKFGFIGLSFVMALVVILYSFVTINETLSGFTNIIDSFSTFHFVILMVFFTIFVLVLISIIFKALEMFKIKKGLKVED